MEYCFNLHLCNKEKTMRYLLITLFLATTQLFAQTIDLNSTITQATVYRHNAELVSEAGGKLPAGTSEILIKNVSTYINPKSLQVGLKAIGKVSLLSASYETDYINQNDLNAEQKKLKAEIDKLNADLRWAKEQKQIYYDLESVLNDNKKLGGANIGLNPQDLAVLLELYKTKQYEYNTEFLKFEKMEKDLAIEVSKVQNQLNEANVKFNKPSGTIRLQVSAVSPTYVDFRCAYIVNNAGWEPIYDLRSEGTDKPVDLIYKANVYQNTGYNWDRVNLIVSTGNPIQNNNRPVLNPLYVNYYQPQYYGSNSQLETVTIQSKKMNMAYAEDLEIQEVDVVRFDQGFNYNNQVSTSTFSTQYEIELPQSVPSDGKYHLVGMETYSLPSEYVYHTVPKLDKGAFLLAKVSDWGQYNLLPGQANIFFEGAYVGESTINPNVSSDTLLLSMGRDESIKITRVELKDFTSSKLIGSNKKESYAYEIEVRNNKNVAINIEVLDQIPVSNNKEIQVEVEEFGGAQYNSEIGKLEWVMNIAPNQSKKVKFVYSIKYPKNQIIQGQK